MKIKKGICKLCGEERLLDKLDRCIFCTTNYHGSGREVKVSIYGSKIGIEVKSKSGNKKENIEMNCNY